LTFTESNYNQEHVLELKSKHNEGVAGYVTIPAKTFKPGCVLRVSSGDADKKEVVDSDCDHNATPVSAALSLEISEPCSSDSFDHHVRIQLYAKVDML